MKLHYLSANWPNYGLTNHRVGRRVAETMFCPLFAAVVHTQSRDAREEHLNQTFSHLSFIMPPISRFLQNLFFILLLQILSKHHANRYTLSLRDQDGSVRVFIFHQHCWPTITSLTWRRPVLRGALFLVCFSFYHSDATLSQLCGFV